MLNGFLLRNPPKFDLVFPFHMVDQNANQPPYEGFSERVTDGSDDDRAVAYGRWLKRLRDSHQTETSLNAKPRRNQSSSAT